MDKEVDFFMRKVYVEVMTDVSGLLAANAPLDIRNTAMARRSTAVVPWQVHYVRDINQDDLVLLAMGQQGPNDRNAPLARIRDPHHTIARYVASEMPAVKISALTGYTPERIRTLIGDPAFQELVAHYTEELVAHQPDIDLQIRHAALSAGQELQRRLDEEPESFSNKTLIDLYSTGLDRIGKGPKSQVDVNIHDPAKVIDKVKQALVIEGKGNILRRDQVVDAEYTEALEASNDIAAPSEGPAQSEDDADGSVRHEGTETNGES